VNSLVSAKISLSKESPLKTGKVEVTLLTSRLISQTPSLTYSFDGIVYNDLPLYGSDTTWKGYLIISKNIEQGVVSFRFKASDLEGRLGQEITNEARVIIHNLSNLLNDYSSFLFLNKYFI
jgi:hypothetical protein